MSITILDLKKGDKIMSKIYGFKQSDILELAEYVKKNQNKSKTKVFSEFAIMKNKAKGTIRNMYYALAKHSKTDENLQKICRKILTTARKGVTIKGSFIWRP